MRTIERKFIIRDRHGVHARMAYVLAATAGKHQSESILLCDDREADCSSILDMLSLAVVCGSIITIRIRGEDAEKAMTAFASIGDLKPVPVSQEKFHNDG